MNFDHIEHYGVPGMRWGVRKQTKIKRGERKALKKQNKAFDKEVKRERLVLKGLEKRQQGSDKWNSANKTHNDRMANDPRYNRTVMNQDFRKAQRHKRIKTGAKFVAAGLATAGALNAKNNLYNAYVTGAI
ncbi:MAG: hypothetical protein E6R03_05865 [Hyphomicrobiaceae bacterium]|nr:MAG: hypothetical protein E6R03_05865 [Hyphomicrobiaceae bacterium]